MKVQLLHLLLARPDTDEAAQLRPGLRLAQTEQLRPLLGQTTARPENNGDISICLFLYLQVNTRRRTEESLLIPIGLLRHLQEKEDVSK